jgi:hypothetical protein
VVFGVSYLINLGALGVCCLVVGSVKKWNKILPLTIGLTNKRKHEFDGEKGE